MLLLLLQQYTTSELLSSLTFAVRVLHGLVFCIYYSSAMLSSGNFAILTGDLYKDSKLFVALFHEENTINTNPWYLHCKVLTPSFLNVYS